jgi:hypothetical protein
MTLSADFAFDDEPSSLALVIRQACFLLFQNTNFSVVTAPCRKLMKCMTGALEGEINNRQEGERFSTPVEVE